MSKRRRFRRFVAVLILLLLVLAGGWTAIWYLVAGQLADRLASWERSATAAGITIRHDPPVRTGWPMAAGIRLTHVSVQGGDAYLPGGGSWQADQVVLAQDIRHVHDVFIGIDGRQSVTLGHRPPIAFQAQKMAALGALLPGGGLGLVQGSASAILAAWPAGGGRVQPVTIASVAAAVNADDASLTVAAQLHGVGLPRSHIAALGNPALLSFDAVVAGTARDPRLTLRAFTLEDGPLVVKATGRFDRAIDRKPRGKLAVTATGLEQGLQRLAVGKVMTMAEARALGGVAALVMAPNRPASLSLDDGLVRLGPIPLFRWPQ